MKFTRRASWHWAQSGLFSCKPSFVTSPVCTGAVGGGLYVTAAPRFVRRMPILVLAGPWQRKSTGPFPSEAGLSLMDYGLMRPERAEVLLIPRAYAREYQGRTGSRGQTCHRKWSDGPSHGRIIDIEEYGSSGGT